MNVLTNKSIGLRRSDGAESTEVIKEVGVISIEDSPRLFRSLFVDTCLDNSGLCSDTID